MIERKKVLYRGIVLSAILFVGIAGSAGASTLVPQTWLPGDCIPQFAAPLPVFGPAGPIPRVNAIVNKELTVTMKETAQQVLPDYTAPPLGCPAVEDVTIQPTRVWAYEISNMLTGRVLGPAHWPAVTVEARRNIPTVVKYVNRLPSFNPSDPNGPGMVQGLISVDQTLHWADPLGLGCVMKDPPVDCSATPDDPCCQPFTGPVPAVVHLHGGEVPSSFDGGPDAWFTPDGIKGPAYSTLFNINPGPGKAIYLYNNSQEPGTPWFHDHALGATRTNVYSGMAAFYFIRQPSQEPKKLPDGPFEIEMAIQDRQFDTKSQLFFPDGSGPKDCTAEDGTPVPCSNLNGPPPNPSVHPFWIPEFIGDVVIVNGAPWPFLNVEPRRYRLRVLDGSNARFYNLTFGDTGAGETPAPVWVIGADDAYLDVPVPVNTVFIAPGERADIIVDFTSLAGKTVTVKNDAPIPFPAGLVPGVDQPGMANIMRFSVSAAPVRDNSCDPASPSPRNGFCARQTPLVRLTDGNGTLAPGVKIDKKRQLVLKEVIGLDDAGNETGPLEVLVNNTKWDGLKSPSVAAIFPADGVSELPRVGSTELWEIINLTADAHPMHTHLTQFQILNRQAFTDGYPAAWEAAFGSGPVPLPAGCTAGQFCPGFGPPLAYNVLNADGALGGNPAISPFLDNVNFPPTPPEPAESGWKDTAKANPGEVLRIVVRWAPTSTPVKQSRPGLNFYPFDPTQGPGYVWHCHIIDHEDNEMMRPYKVTR